MTAAQPPKAWFRFKKDYYGYLFMRHSSLRSCCLASIRYTTPFALSFTNTTLMGGENAFVGLDNYVRLFDTPTFMKAIGNTWLLWILNFLPQIGIALLLSVWFTSVRLKIRAVGIWRTIFYLPNLLMPAAIAALFFSLFSFFGPVNQALVRSGAIADPCNGCRIRSLPAAWLSSSSGGCGLGNDHSHHGRHDFDLRFTL